MLKLRRCRVHPAGHRRDGRQAGTSTAARGAAVPCPWGVVADPSQSSAKPWQSI